MEQLNEWHRYEGDLCRYTQRYLEKLGGVAGNLNNVALNSGNDEIR